MPTIQAQVKLADIKRLMMGNVCQFYMCHNVAHLLEPELEKEFPDYREFANKGMDGLTGYNGMAYHFLCINEITGLDFQVVSCIHNFMKQIDPSIEDLIYGSQEYLYRHIMLKFLNLDDAPYNRTGRQLRIDTLGKILSVHPDATMPIEMKV